MRKELIDAYYKYLWEKCSISTYRNRIQKWWDFIEAVKPVEKGKWHRKWMVVSKRFPDEMDWYFQQECAKVNRSTYYQRLYRGYPKEEAIKLNVEPKKKKVIVEAPKIWYIRKPKPQKKPENDNDIRIRYSKEEWAVIRKEYERMIEELEYRWRASDDPIEAKSILAQLDMLKDEYNVFLIYNY